MLPHEWLTAHMQGLHEYARVLKDALTDPALAPEGKSAAAAAAKYLVEWEDFVPDQDPLFGYVDDLFVILLGLSELCHAGGPVGMAYADKKLPSGETLGQAINDAQAMFPGFLGALVGEVGAGFQHVAQQLADDPGHMQRLVPMLATYIDAYAKNPRPLHPLDEASVDAFLSQYAPEGGA
jgi:uncharacterized membrane protein YkvA (DUF1232 family)